MLRRIAWYLTLAAVTAMPLYVVRFSVAGLPSTLLEVLVLAAAAATFLAHRRSLKPLPWIASLAALWTIVGFASSFRSGDILSSLGLWRAYFLEPVLLGWAIWQNVLAQTETQRAASLRRIVAAMVTAGSTVAVYATYQHFTGYGIPHPWQEESVRRVTAWLGYPNAVALLVAPLTWLAVGLGLKAQHVGRSVGRYLYPVAAAAMILAVLFARSEGGLIGLAAGAATAGLLHSKLSRLVTLGVIVAAAIAVAAVPTWRSYAVRTATLNDCPVLYECSLTLRRTQWADTWTMLKDGRLLYGAGLGNYQATMLPYHNHPGIEIYLYPHNVFLNFWTETGLAGLILFLGIIAAFWRSVWHALRTLSRPLVIGAAAAMVTLLVHGLVDVPFFKNDLSVLLWLIILLPLLAQRIDANTEKN